MNNQYPGGKPTIEARGQYFVEGLEAQHEYKAKRLSPMVVEHLPRRKQGLVETPAIMNFAERRSQGVRQELLAVVKADREVFAVVNVKMMRHTNKASYYYDERLAITRFQPDGSRAQLVGFVEPNKPFIVGRSHQEGLDEGTSREHFAVALREDGVAGVADMNSTNGTELITPQIGAMAEDAINGIENPALDINTWSVKSSEMRWAMEDAR